MESRAVPSTNNGDNIKIAIIGGGIVGVVTALGLLKRGINVELYEQARSLREIGAGLAFTTNAQRCMELLDPKILAAMRAVSTKNVIPYYNYVDGFHCESDDQNDMSEKQLFQLYAGNTGFDGCHRAHFLDELVKHLPPDVVKFQKRLHTYTVGDGGLGITLNFVDGTSATADAVIGCDGIKSRVRQLLFGEDNPASYPSYAHQVAYRGLIQMDKALAALGEEKALNQCMHMGPKGHILNFPVAQHTLMNVVAFADDEGEWPHEKLTAPATREEVVRYFEGWGPAVRTIAGLLDDSLDKWAIFDTYDHPAPTFSKGCICIAGDAAHATSPHHGAGAGFGVEDALALGTVIQEAITTLKAGGASKEAVLSASFRAYDAARRERAQWLVRSSRQVCKTYEWANPDCGDDPELCLKDIEWRAHKIWYFDIDGMIRDAKSAYQKLVQNCLDG
ncbi:Salicylate hydroxylase [Daldinia childiae]|uniref:Salicylate hydroxylase n=1 Tax=Daldinia childiae TaxID=326645 RepID=UPI00144874F9|nr:Salicylate hydroxylase [Daldinia childiae]KAF3055965.1 Salicylate hydroxylase [Daldinia childiae]